VVRRGDDRVRFGSPRLALPVQSLEFPDEEPLWEVADPLVALDHPLRRPLVARLDVRDRVTRRGGPQDCTELVGEGFDGLDVRPVLRSRLAQQSAQLDASGIYGLRHVVRSRWLSAVDSCPRLPTAGSVWLFRRMLEGARSR